MSQLICGCERRPNNLLTAGEFVRQVVDDDVDRAPVSAVVGVAHQLGMRTNCTMLYGHIETFEHRVDHLLQLRALQEETGGFQCFIPLAFYPPDTQLSHLPGPSGVDSLKTMAVSRLMLDNFDHIKAYWVMLGKRLAGDVIGPDMY